MCLVELLSKEILVYQSWILHRSSRIASSRVTSREHRIIYNICLLQVLDPDQVHVCVGETPLWNWYGLDRSSVLWAGFATSTELAVTTPRRHV